MRKSIYGNQFINPYLREKAHLKEWVKSNLKNEDKSMYNKFENVSQKVIKVDPQTFELIVDHDLRAIHIQTEIAEKITGEFIIRSQDAALLVKKETDFNSSLQIGLSVVEFTFVVN